MLFKNENLWKSLNDSYIILYADFIILLFVADYLPF